MLCVLTLFTGCKEIFGNLDLNGGAAVDPYLQLGSPSASIGVGQTYQIKATTISDATITYSSNNPSVATVDATGKVTGVNLGETSIIVRVAESTNYKAGVAEFKVKVGLVSLEEASAIIGYGKDYTIKAKTAATGATLTFESKNTAVATVDATGKVTAVSCGDAIIVVTSTATDTYPAETADFTANVRVQDYDQLKSAIENASTSEKTTIKLDGSSTISATNHIDMKGKEIALEGNGATIVTEYSLIISKSFTLENAKFDLTSATNNRQFIQIDASEETKVNQDVYADAKTKDVKLIDYITIKDVWVKNLKNALIDPMQKSTLALSNLTIENCIIQLDHNNTKSLIDFSRVTKDSNKGAIKNVIIKDNTIYNLQEASAYFIRFANASESLKLFGNKDNGTSSLNHQFLNNTIYNVFPNQNFGNNTPNDAVFAITMTGNIFGQVKYIQKYVQDNQAPVLTISDNYIFGSAKQSNDYTERSKTVGDVTYKWTIATKLDDAPFTVPTVALDLTKENGGLNLKPSGAAAAAGDPRWLK